MLSALELCELDKYGNGEVGRLCCVCVALLVCVACVFER